MSDYTSETKNIGDFRCETRFTRGDKIFCTDLSKDFGGLEEYPAPGQLLAASVASCMISMVSYVAKIGRASCRERVYGLVYIPVVAV